MYQLFYFIHCPPAGCHSLIEEKEPHEFMLLNRSVFHGQVNIPTAWQKALLTIGWKT